MIVKCPLGTVRENLPLLLLLVLMVVPSTQTSAPFTASPEYSFVTVPETRCVEVFAVL